MLQQEITSGLPLRAEKISIGPFDLNALTERDAISEIRAAIVMRRRMNVAICNAHTLLTAFDDQTYADVLQKMTLLNDGIGVNIANMVLNGRRFPANLNGTDFVPQLLKEIGIPLRIYLLGARSEQLDGAAAAIAADYPLHKVVGKRNGYFDAVDIETICADISAAKPDLLLVAMGNPRQERFIMEHQDKLHVTVAIGVGALFDFMSGSVVRAPRILQFAGLEWLFRFAQEPRRLFRRYVVGIPRFLYRVWRLKRDA
ncbi:WecB/TagA/CpsF family glycosyltransferase [Roseibium sediminis]|uniref:WecB/TagA/CpsF family glycosyltransferase n=1 Tax=Roseibium sediminis TaxID=1775174 RepID=UPI00123D4CF0|nr:WecB/TagA/CpsF family glycosyltransferase [Roseibium sediminis]